MPRPYILAETNWKHLKDETIDLAILPWGATEAHNYHLPYGTDNFEAEGLAAEAARLAWERGAKVMVLPAVPFGVNSGQTDIFLDMNLNGSTQMAILRDLIQVLDRQGVKKLLVFNSHGGNTFKPLLKELGLEFPEMFLCTSNWFQSVDKKQYFEEPGDHADEMETSLVMYLRPELVLPLEEAGPGAERKHRIKAFGEGWVSHERRWSQITEDTGVGDPGKSSAAKGERFFRDVTEKFAQLFVELTDLEIDNMYI